MIILTGKAGIAERRSFPIVAYIGPNGSGKSLHAVADSLPSLRSGRQVLSTVKLLGDDGEAHPLWVPFRSWADLLDAEHCDVLMDEVTGVASARDAGGLPGPVANILVQLRRRDVVLRWTAPSWRRADRIIRECTQAVVICSGYFPRKVEGRMWPSSRIFRATIWDAAALDDEVDGVRRTKPFGRAWSQLGGLGGAARGYDTLDRVMALPVIEGGRCAVCGGRRRVPSCSCEAGESSVSADNNDPAS